MCCALADLTTAHDSLVTALQQAANKQVETDTELADSKTEAQRLAKELQEVQAAAAAAAEEAAAGREQLERERAELRDGQVCT